MVTLFICILSFLTVNAEPKTHETFPVPGIFKKKKEDKMGERHGRWKFYADAQNQKLTSKGRFKHGKEVGAWRFYDSKQNLQKLEKYRKNRQIIKTTYYYPNGKIEKIGQAKLYEDATMLHYYWQGPWKFYSESGEFLRTEFYEKGVLQVKQKAEVKP